LTFVKEAARSIFGIAVSLLVRSTRASEQAIRAIEASSANGQTGVRAEASACPFVAGRGGGVPGFRDPA
jgi:hypothetical protein